MLFKLANVEISIKTRRAIDTNLEGFLKKFLLGDDEEAEFIAEELLALTS